MNCKQGDLAVIVRSDSGNEGVIVQCLRLYVGPWLRPDGALDPSEPGWFVSRPVKARSDGADCWCIADRKLRPLRDGEGEDEMLRLVGLPNAGTPQAA